MGTISESAVMSAVVSWFFELVDFWTQFAFKYNIVWVNHMFFDNMGPQSVSQSVLMLEFKPSVLG